MDRGSVGSVRARFNFMCGFFESLSQKGNAVGVVRSGGRGGL